MRKQTLWLVLLVVMVPILGGFSVGFMKWPWPIAALLGAVSGGVGAALFIKHDTNS